MVRRVSSTSRAAATNRVQRSDDRHSDQAVFGETIDSPLLAGADRLAIVIVDRRPLFRDCLVGCLESVRNDCVVFSCSSISEWLAVASDYPQPAVLVVCVSGDRSIDPNVRRELAKLSARKSYPPPLIVSETQDLESVASMLVNAVREHLSNGSSSRSVMKSRYVVGRGVSHARNGGDRVEGGDGLRQLLNARQMAVLSALQQGKHIKQIAGELRIRQGTVRVHVHKIMKKLNVESAEDVADLANQLSGAEQGVESGRRPSAHLSAGDRKSRILQTNSGKLRVVVIDPQKLRQAGLASLLDDWAEANGLEISTISAPTEFDLGLNCAIVVLNVGGASVLEREPNIWIKRIRAAVPNVPLAVFSDREDRSEILSAFGEGATGFISTSQEPSLALEALTFLLRGGSFFPLSALLEEANAPGVAPFDGRSERPSAIGPPASADTWRASPDPQSKSTEKHEDQPHTQLTPRQAEVLERLREGKPNKLIARELNMTEATVKVHVRQIMRKFGAANRTQVVLCAAHLSAAD